MYFSIRIYNTKYSEVLLYSICSFLTLLKGFNSLLNWLFYLNSRSAWNIMSDLVWTSDTCKCASTHTDCVGRYIMRSNDIKGSLDHVWLDGIKQLLRRCSCSWKRWQRQQILETTHMKMVIRNHLSLSFKQNGHSMNEWMNERTSDDP